MKRPSNLLASVLGALHLAFSLLFFTMYFATSDPERGMILFLVIFTDPWVLPIYSNFAGSIQDEIQIAVIVVLFGSALWWAIGWALAKIATVIKKKKEPNQAPDPTPPSGVGPL